jgi:hypothetical protein
MDLGQYRLELGVALFFLLAGMLDDCVLGGKSRGELLGVVTR